MNNNRRILEDEARSHGATDIRIEYGSKHPVLVCTFRGREIRCQFSGTPKGKTKGVDVELQRLRNLMGVRRRKVNNGHDRSRRRVSDRPAPVPQITVKPDPFAALAPIHERHELERRCQIPGIDGACARVELAGLMACDRIRAYAAEIAGGRR